MSDRPAAAAVFDDLIATLTEIRDGYVLDDDAGSDLESERDAIYFG